MIPKHFGEHNPLLLDNINKIMEYTFRKAVNNEKKID